MNPLLAALVEAGILTPDDAERMDRQLDPAIAQDHAERTLIQSFANGLSLQQRRVLGLLDDTEGNPTPRQLSLLWDGENELLFASVADDLRSVALERAVTASIGATNGVGDETWQLVNEEVLDWVDGYYVNPDAGNFGSIPNLNETSKTQFTQAFNDWQRGELGIAGRTATGELRQGLDALITALEPTFGLRRAEAIGVTETSRVFAQSEIAASRANPFVTVLLWLTANDERVCPICGPRANLVVAKESDGFRVPTDNTVGYPPAHVRCRCSLTQLTEPALAALREEGLISDGPDGATKAAAIEPVTPPVANFDNPISGVNANA